jgi:hypothetical protein
MTGLFNLEGLTPMQLGRVQKSLAKQFRFSSGIMTLQQWLECLAITGKRATDSRCNWNRTKFNRMDQRQQDAYEKRLRDTPRYCVDYGDNFSMDIPKIVFDVLNVEQTI